MCREKGQERALQFVWNPFKPTLSALAFGHAGAYTIALSGGPVAAFFSDRPTFRAIVLHELAHVYNADIGKTYLTIAIWQAFVAISGSTITAYSLFEVYTHHGDAQPATAAGRLLILALVVYIIRNSVLRARELYANQHVLL